MSDYLVPLLIVLALLIGVSWALLRRRSAMLWRSDEYRALLDTLEDAILVYDVGDHLIYMNRAARTWFGFDEAESYETQHLRAHITPTKDFLALLSHGGRASLRIGPRYVEAVSQRVQVQGTSQIKLVLHDVTASQALLEEERRRGRELAMFNEINRVTNANLNLDELLNGILDKIKHVSPYTSAAISLWNPRTDQLIVRGCIGSMTQLEEKQPLDSSYASHVMRQLEPLLLSDTSQQPELRKDPAIRSYVGVPLLAGTNFIGTLELTSDQVGAFSTKTLDTLGVVASHTAVAIENARLYGETLLRAEELTTMNTLSSAINASLNLDELLEIIVFSIGQVIGCDRVAISLMDNERGVLSLAKAHALGEEFIRRHQNIRPELGGQGEVVLDRYPLVVSDVRQAEAPAEYVSLLMRDGISAYADLPLRGREHVLGALTVYYDQPHSFDEPELELMRTLANQVTLALENARLYERTDRALARRVDQLAAIEEIGRELSSTLDITRVFNLVLQRAMGTTGASAGLLALGQPANEKLELIVDQGYPPGTFEHYRREGWPTTQGIVGRVARTGTMALVNDVRADPNYISHLPTTCAQLAVPIVKEAHVLGVVSLESSRPQGFSPDDGRFITQLAELAAIAIDNARLFQQVREGRDNLQAILDSTREAILVVGRDKRVVLANPMIEQISGLSAQALVGRRVSELAADPDPRVLLLLGYKRNELDKVLSLLDATSGQVVRRTYEIPGSPSRFVVQVASPVIDKDSGVVGRLVVFRDVTEERNLAAMRQDLTDMIIHDLRSPLTAVVSGVQVASDLTETSADSVLVQNALVMADQSCNRLMSLVDSLLDISRLEAGQMPLERQPVLLPKLATSVIQQMEPLAKREMVTLQLRTVSPLPPVDADYELISRVLVNLVDNALKHSPRNSTVTIQIAPIPLNGEQGATDPATASVVSADSPSPSVRCTVLDTGPGVPNEHRARVFERFAQLDGRRRGKGLGLAFCQLAVQAHGGRIWIDDNPHGRGSAFSFDLPVVSPELLSITDQDLDNPPG